MEPSLAEDEEPMAGGVQISSMLSSLVAWLVQDLPWPQLGAGGGLRGFFRGHTLGLSGWRGGERDGGREGRQG